MLARYYGGDLPRFLSPDPLGGVEEDPQSHNRYAYVSNNPINRVDPDGLYGINPNPYHPKGSNPCDGMGPMCYGRGPGWSDKEWKKFDRAQRKAEEKARKAAEKLQRAINELRSGKPLSRAARKTLKQFEHAVGVPADAARMGQVESNLRASAGALADDGSNGYFAHGMNSSQWASFGRSKDASAAGEVGGRNIFINLAHPSFGGGSTFEWAIGHESLHNAGMSDQSFMGSKVYQFGLNPGLVRALALSNPGLAIQNPDNVMGLVH